MIERASLPLGRKAIKTDSRTLRLARYLMPTLPAAPDEIDWTAGVTNFGMMRNDILGCCTIAAAGHAVQIWSLNSVREEATLDDLIIQQAYSAWCGYVPGEPFTDQGGVELDVLNDWRKQGLGGQQLLAFAAVNPKDLTEVQQAINLFGGLYIGISLPRSAQQPGLWDVSNGPNGEPGSWGGHAVYVPKSSFGKTKTCITWAELQDMTDAFWLRYVDEAYALLGAAWMHSNVSPGGFDLQQLQADLSLIR